MTIDFGPALSLLDRFVGQYIETTGAPGVSIGLTDRSGTIRVSTHGLAEISSRTPVEKDTLFEIGSISKSFASVCVMQLADEGKIDVNVPLQEYLPWFEVRSKYEPITLHHIMTHTSGIVTGSESTLSGEPGVWALRETRTCAPPGDYFHYSNVGYKVVGLVLEQVLRKPIGVILKERVLDRLGMASSEATITSETRKRLAVGYTPYYDDRPYLMGGPLVPATWLESDTADGSISSTPEDMTKYLRFILNNGRGPNGPMISEKGFSALTNKWMAVGPDAPGTFYGYGLDVEEKGGHTRIGHTGGMVGFVSSIMMDMEDGLGIAVMVNGYQSADIIAKFGLDALVAALHGGALPSVPARGSHLDVANASDYVGRYTRGAKGFSVALNGQGLSVDYKGVRTPLQPRAKGRYVVDHPDFRLFELGFSKEDGVVQDAHHGSDYFVKDGSVGPHAFKHPRDWEVYTGHYRSYNPWLSNFRILVRKSELLLIIPSAELDTEEPLVPVEGGMFRMGRDERSPETIRFDQVLYGKAQRAVLSCGESYYRVFAP